jgi:DNA-binding MarR family transcriptional regulator
MGITEKEFIVIREISNNHNPNQRIIAKNAEISLGLTNIIIKRLVNKGYIKIQQIPPRRIKYMLTPKGLAEKAKKTYSFTLKTISLINSIKNHTQQVINEEIKKGADKFIISGTGELITITEIAFRDLGIKGIEYNIIEDKEKTDTAKTPYCRISFVVEGERKELDLLSELAKSGLQI